jgi:hypothetical protein
VWRFRRQHLHAPPTQFLSRQRKRGMRRDAVSLLPPGEGRALSLSKGGAQRRMKVGSCIDVETWCRFGCTAPAVPSPQPLSRWGEGFKKSCSFLPPGEGGAQRRMRVGSCIDVERGAGLVAPLRPYPPQPFPMGEGLKKDNDELEGCLSVSRNGNARTHKRRAANAPHMPPPTPCQLPPHAKGFDTRSGQSKASTACGDL